jgi:cytochrome P450
VNLDPAVMADPFPLYRRLRAAGPVHRVTLPNGRSVWLVTRYEEARAALADPRLSLDKRNAAAGSWSGFGLPPALDANLLNLDPPDHTRIRRVIATAFTPRRVESLRGRVQATVDECLDRVADRFADRAAGQGRAELVAELALPLALTTMCDLIGVAAEDRRDFRTWTAVLAAQETGQPADLAAAVGNIYRYFADLIAHKRAEPADDLTSALVAARDDEDRLSEDELISAAWLTTLAGNENTVRGIVNGILALLTNPEALAHLRAHPQALPVAVEELLRYDGPTQLGIRRFALRDMTIGDVTVPAGDAVMVAIACANRDERRFVDPDTLDPTRTDNQHLAFGNGIHYCFGAPLARLEAEVAIGTLLRRFPDLALAVPEAELRWQLSIRSRDLIELPVRLTQAGADSRSTW